jgi:excinuclease UvrABC ATPase subunit
VTRIKGIETKNSLLARLDIDNGKFIVNIKNHSYAISYDKVAILTEKQKKIYNIHSFREYCPKITCCGAGYGIDTEPLIEKVEKLTNELLPKIQQAKTQYQNKIIKGEKQQIKFPSEYLVHLKDKHKYILYPTIIGYCLSNSPMRETHLSSQSAQSPKSNSFCFEDLSQTVVSKIMKYILLGSLPKINNLLNDDPEIIEEIHYIGEFCDFMGIDYYTDFFRAIGELL